jgi:hypothetical protein
LVEVAVGAGFGLRAGAGAFVDVAVEAAVCGTGPADGAFVEVTFAADLDADDAALVEVAVDTGFGLRAGAGAFVDVAVEAVLDADVGAFVKVTAGAGAVGGGVLATVAAGLGGILVLVLDGGAAGGVSDFFGDVKVATSVSRPDSSMAEAVAASSGVLGSLASVVVR